MASLPRLTGVPSNISGTPAEVSGKDAHSIAATWTGIQKSQEDISIFLATIRFLCLSGTVTEQILTQISGLERNMSLNIFVEQKHYTWQ